MLAFGPKDSRTAPTAAPGCGAIGPEGYRCTSHEEGQHVARGTEPDSFAEAWPITEKEATEP